LKGNTPKDKTIPGAGPKATTNTPKDKTIKLPPNPGAGSKATTLRGAFPNIKPTAPSHTTTASPATQGAGHPSTSAGAGHGGGPASTATHDRIGPPTGGSKAPETKTGGGTKEPVKAGSDPKGHSEPKAHPAPGTKTDTKVSAATDHAPAPASGPNSKTTGHEPSKPDTQKPGDHAAAQDPSKGKKAGGASPDKSARPKNPSTGISANQRKPRQPSTPPPKAAPKTSSFLGNLTKAYGSKLAGVAKSMVKDAATSIAQDVSKQAVAVASE
jgi:hypothetical protein